MSATPPGDEAQNEGSLEMSEMKSENKAPSLVIPKYEVKRDDGPAPALPPVNLVCHSLTAREPNILHRFCHVCFIQTKAGQASNSNMSAVNRITYVPKPPPKRTNGAPKRTAPPTSGPTAAAALSAPADPAARAEANGVQPPLPPDENPASANSSPSLVSSDASDASPRRGRFDSVAPPPEAEAESSDEENDRKARRHDEDDEGGDFPMMM
jgi:hypothetical protein